MPQEALDDHREKPDRAVVAIQSGAQLLTSLVETFGIAGTLLILGFWFVVWYATPEQKQRIIETYVLGSGIARTWPILIMGLTCVIVIFAQRWFYKKKLSALSGEIEREGKAKSALQEKGIKTKLQHAQTTTAKPKRR